MKGFIHLYTGDGKGKSTAALGLCLRCAGSGGKAIYTQFLKDNKSSELKILNTISEITFIPSDKAFGFYINMSEEDKKEAKEVYSRLLKKVIEQAVASDCRMLVLDEIIAAYNHELINQQDFCDFLINKPESLEVIMTGRNPDVKLLELADYVSEIKKVKHPFDKGVRARVGIEM